MVDHQEYIIISKNPTFSLKRVAEAAEAVEHPLVVYAEERDSFLRFFFRLWKEKKNEYNIQGLRNLAEYLHAFVDFRSADNDESSVGVSTIEKELFKLKSGHR